MNCPICNQLAAVVADDIILCSECGEVDRHKKVKVVDKKQEAVK